MNRAYQRYVRPRLFAMSKEDPEVAHEWALKHLETVSNSRILRFLISIFGVVRDKRLTQIICGLTFRTPVGLAAGMDKYATAFPAYEALGFCGVEVGGFTLLSQPGNERPRLFRLEVDEALINRYGFNNPGANMGGASMRLAPRISVPVGVNMGKSADTPLEEAGYDYYGSLRATYSYGDYFVVNVSSPNTLGLRRLQGKAFLSNLLNDVQQEARRLARELHASPKPVFVKISPDLTWEEVDDFIFACRNNGVDGIMGPNTTISRTGITSDIDEQGGLSGPPLRGRALEMMRYLTEHAPDLVRIGMGGISTSEDAYNMFRAGAHLAQLLTALIYRGPFVAAEINLGLLRLMERDNINHISELRNAA